MIRDPTERRSVLRKQSEIEEVDDEDNSPSSDQSDTTITAGADTQAQSQGNSPDTDSPNDSKQLETEKLHVPPVNGQDIAKPNHVEMSLLTVSQSQKKPLIRSEAMVDDVSPPGERVSSGTYPEPSIISSPTTKRLQVTERNYLQQRSESSEAGSSSIDSSFESRDPYKDPSGIDLEDFIKKTLQKTPKDRNMLLKIEKDLTKFIKEPKHHYLKFPEMSSYDRMLVHRVAAYFGLDHNVDQTGKCVIVNKTAHTRIPDFCFKEYGGKESHQPRKILPRNGASFNEQDYRTTEKQLLGELKKTQSFEERQIRYAQVRSKIFKDGSCENQEEMEILKMRPENLMGSSKEDLRLHPWSSTDSSSGYATDSSVKSKGPPMLKANSYGGTPSAQTCMLQCITSSSFNKQDSVSSGASSNLGSPMPRPVVPTTPPGSHSDNSSLSGSSGGVPAPVQSPVSNAGGLPPQGTMYWIVTDAGSIPVGSIIIDPKNGQPLCNKDGSLYRYNPNQLPVSFQQIAHTHPTPQFSNVNTENQPSSSDLCQPMTSLTLQPQSATENVQMEYPPAQSQHPVVIQTASSTIPPFQQQASVPQQHSYVQGNFIQGSPHVAGQPVQYLYQVRNPSPVQSAVSIDSQGQPQPLPPNTGQYQQQPHTYIPTITYYQNSPYQQVAMTTQCSDSYGTNLQTSQIQGSQSEGNIQGYTTYPVAMGTLNQSTYGGQPQQHSVPTSSNPQIVFGCGGHNVYRAPTPPIQGVGASSNSNSSVNVAQTQNVVSPASGPSPTNPQFVSFQNFQRFPSQYHNPSPQILQYSPVQTPAPSQTFQVVRPGMQLSMPMGATQSVVPGGHAQTVNNVKNFSTDHRLVRQDDSKDIGSNIIGYQVGVASNPPAGTFIRPPAPYAAGQSVLRPPLQSSTYPHQPQPIPNSPQQFQVRQRMPINSSGKPSYVKAKKSKSLNKDTAVISQTSSESDVNQTGNNILEVCELAPHLQRADADRILKDLISSGASIHYVPKEVSISDSTNLTVSDCKMILAIFSDAASANHALINQCSSYVLKSTIGSGEPLES